MAKSEASRSSDQKLVVDSIIDEQIDLAKLAKEAYEAGVKSSDRIMAMARRIRAMVLSKKVTTKRGKELLRQGMAAIELIEFARFASKIQELAEYHSSQKSEARKAYGKPLHTVGMVRNVEIKARENERAGATNDKGVVDGGK